MSTQTWTQGNRLRLLENGEEYFPRVIELVDAAKQEVLIETFILFEDKVGLDLRQALIRAAHRGVKIALVADGFGSADLSPQFIDGMRVAGISFEFYDPQPRVFSVRTNLFRRLHRKTVVVDAKLALIGGINFSEEHLRSFGAQSKQDYAVEIEGPVVAQVHSYFLQQNRPRRLWQKWPRLRRVRAKASGLTGAMLVVRDNERHRDDIEHVYRLGIRLACKEIVIANAYFLPGYRLMRDLRNAARRGVKVHLILQGNPDKPIVSWATSALQDYLLQSGVKIYEFQERPLHAKVAVIDQFWATVGSSNLDPLSLYLNLESNIVTHDTKFATDLRNRLMRLREKSCQEVSLRHQYLPTPVRRALSTAAFHLLRRVPAIVGWLPGHSAEKVGGPPQ